MAEKSCPHCTDEMLLEQGYGVRLLGTTKTNKHSVPYTDHLGKRHVHDENVVTEMRECSYGHRWPTRLIVACECGWPTKTEESELLRTKR